MPSARELAFGRLEVTLPSIPSRHCYAAEITARGLTNSTDPRLLAQAFKQAATTLKATHGVSLTLKTQDLGPSGPVQGDSVLTGEGYHLLQLLMDYQRKVDDMTSSGRQGHYLVHRECQEWDQEIPLFPQHEVIASLF